MRMIDADKLPYVNKVVLVDKSDGDIVIKIAKEYTSYVNDETPTVEAIPIEWLKNKRDELEKEYYDLFHAYTDESRNNQVWLLNNFRAFNTVLRYWEKENEID